jgi:hypothetical protein
MLESDECKLLAEYLRILGLKFTHIANEGKIPVQYRMKQKALGLNPGVPDYMIKIPAERSKHGHSHLIFIEMKREKGGKLSDYQR